MIQSCVETIDTNKEIIIENKIKKKGFTKRIRYKK
jgi:hypothetical protein